MSCSIVCIAFMFYVFVLNVLPCTTVLYCIDVRLSHLNNDYLLTYLLTSHSLNSTLTVSPYVRYGSCTCTCALPSGTWPCAQALAHALRLVTAGDTRQVH